MSKQAAGAIAALRNPDPAARVAAARSIGAAQRQEALPALVTAMMDDDDGTVRRAAQEALEQFPAPVRLRPLLAVLRDPDCTTYRSQVVGHMVERLDASMTADLIDVLRDGREAGEARTWAASALGHIGTAAAADALLAVYASGDESLDYMIVMTGEHFPEPRFHALLLGLAADPARDRGFRNEAVYGLSRHGGRDVIRLLRALLDDTDGLMRVDAILGLGRCGDATVLPTLTRIRDTDDAHRDWAEEAIRAIRARE